MTLQEKPDGGSRSMAVSGNQDIGKLLVDQGPDQSIPDGKRWPAETPSPATLSERVPPKRGRVDSY